MRLCPSPFSGTESLIFYENYGDNSEVELSGRVTFKSVLQIHCAVFLVKSPNQRTTELEAASSLFQKPAQTFPDSPGDVGPIDFLAWGCRQQTGPQPCFSPKMRRQPLRSFLVINYCKTREQTAGEENRLKGSLFLVSEHNSCDHPSPFSAPPPSLLSLCRVVTGPLRKAGLSQGVPHACSSQRWGHTHWFRKQDCEPA